MAALRPTSAPPGGGLRHTDASVRILAQRARSAAPVDHSERLGLYRDVLVQRSAAEFRERASGAYVAGDHWLYFSVDPELFGFSLWGSPSREDVAALVREMEDELDRPPHAVLVDVSGVESLAPAAFDLIVGYVTEHGPRLSLSVTQAAIVRSHGFNRALASGFFAAVEAPFPVAFCDGVAEALIHLGGSPDLAGALSDARARVEGVSRLLRDLRVTLDARSTSPSIEELATAMAVSVRTLQRELSRVGTSYQKETQEARLRRAERLLLETDESLTVIAFDVGCASPQHFSTLFRKRRGVTPSEFRALKKPARR